MPTTTDANSVDGIGSESADRRTSRAGEPNGAVDKAISVLEALVNSAPAAQLATISAESGVSKSNAHAILGTLVRRGYARSGGNGAYEPGPKILALAGRVLSTLDFSSHARPSLMALHSRFPQVAVHFGVLSGSDLVYVDKLDARRAYRMASTVGMRLSFHCTAMGKAVLAELPPEARRSLVSGDLVPHTPHTITDLHELDLELEKVAAAGFAVDNEENEEGVRCIAAAVFGSLGRVVGGVSISAPAFELSRLAVEGVASHVMEAAAEISQSLGATESVIDGRRQLAASLRVATPNPVRGQEPPTPSRPI
jgi:IclR family transcriptional regulator, acetate operon repressor